MVMNVRRKKNYTIENSNPNHANSDRDVVVGTVKESKRKMHKDLQHLQRVL